MKKPSISARPLSFEIVVFDQNWLRSGTRLRRASANIFGDTPRGGKTMLAGVISVAMGRLNLPLASSAYVTSWPPLLLRG